jgi:hypothetical protein
MLASAILGPLIGKVETSLRSGLRRRRFGFNPDRIAFRLALLLPWMVLACGSPDYAAIATLWGLAFAESADILDIPLEECRVGGLGAAFKTLMRQGPPPLALPLCAILALALVPGSLVSISLACLGSVLGAAAYASASSRVASRRYIPVPIGGPRRRACRAAGKARGLLACAALLSWGIGELLAPHPHTTAKPGFEYPMPLAREGAAKPMIAEARELCRAETGPILPGLASYLEHKAIQEALPYVRVGESRLDPFAETSLPLPGGEAQIMTFDDAWARKSYASLPPLGVEAMLLSQGGAFVARSGGPSDESAASARGRGLAPIRYLLYIFLLVTPLARFSGGLPLAREPLSGELRQEA